jgi:hypothetical protein
MGLLNRHDAKNSSLIAVVFDKQGITPGDMEPVPTTIQFFKVAIRGPLPFETGNMVTEDTAILFGQYPDKVDDLLFYRQHFLKTEILSCFPPRDGRFGSRHIKIVGKTASLLGCNQRHQQLVKGFARSAEVR